MTDMPNVYYKKKNFRLMTLYLKTLVDRIESCVFKKIIDVIDNKDKYNND